MMCPPTAGVHIIRPVFRTVIKLVSSAVQTKLNTQTVYFTRLCITMHTFINHANVISSLITICPAIVCHVLSTICRKAMAKATLMQHYDTITIAQLRP